MGCIFSSDAPAKPAAGGGGLVTAEGKHKTSAWKQDWQEANWKTDTVQIWQRDLKDLSVHMDLPRLAPRMSILKNGVPIQLSNSMADDDEEGGGGSSAAGPKSKVPLVKELLFILMRELGESAAVRQEAERKFSEFIREDEQGDLSQQLFQFFQQVIRPGSRTERVLKLCHQKMVFPAFYSIKNNLFDVLPFKDQRGTWRVSIDILAEDLVLVKHMKQQVSKDAVLTAFPEYIFEWELYLWLMGDDLGHLDGCDVRIAEIKLREDLMSNRINFINTQFGKHYQVGAEPPRPPGLAHSGDGAGDEGDNGSKGKGRADDDDE